MNALRSVSLNPWFLAGGFVGALASTLVATITQLGRDVLPWTAAALVLHGRST